MERLVACPECGSDKSFKDGLRRLSDGTDKQRFICRTCGYRYALPSNLNIEFAELDNSQIRAKKQVKNLVFAQKTQTCASDAKLSPEVQGLLVQFYSYMENNAYSDDTVYPRIIKQLATLGANLTDTENVKSIIAKLTYKDRKTKEIKKASNGTKAFYCSAYAAFCAMLKIPFDNPGYKQDEKEVYVPYECELDSLITAAKSKRMSAYLRTLKDTYADPGEARRIEWIDIDFQNQTIKINHPVKGHNSGTMPVSPKLLSMISALPHTSQRVFPYSIQSLGISFNRLKRRVVSQHLYPDTTNAERILAVELRGFRHWGGTKIAFDTHGNTLEVKRLLRHKAIQSTMKYIGKINFQKDDYDTTSATTLQDILQLGSSGWIEYSVVKINGEEHHCFKKPKRFSAIHQGGTTQC